MSNEQLIEVYTKDHCPQCVRVKKHLQTEGIPFQEIEITPLNIGKLQEHTRSAPAVFINGEFVDNNTVLAM